MTDSQRIANLEEAGFGVHGIAAVLGCEPADVVAVKRDPSATLPAAEAVAATEVLVASFVFGAIGDTAGELQEGTEATGPLTLEDGRLVAAADCVVQGVVNPTFFGLAEGTAGTVNLTFDSEGDVLGGGTYAWSTDGGAPPSIPFLLTLAAGQSVGITVERASGDVELTGAFAGVVATVSPL